jgi:uncharacterized OB-fold protein
MSEYDPLEGLRPAPVKQDFSQPFWDGAAQGKFLLQYCPESGKYQFYPRPVSVQTGKRNLEWREVSGRGTVYSHTVTYRSPIPVKGIKPYIVALVELEEGVRVMANLVGCPVDAVKIGMPVKRAWVKAGEDNFPAFEPA